MSGPVLGINAFHADASACVLVDGKLVAAVEEERFTRIKHAAGFPASAIAYCLDQAGCTLSELECIAVNSDPRARLAAKLTYVLTHRPTMQLLWSRLRAGLRRTRATREWPLPRAGRWPRVQHVEHHRAHLAAAFYSSAFDEAHCVSVDGFGDFASALTASATPEAITPVATALFPHSLGLFYQAMTQFLGFLDYGDEYKLMGLAAHGDPHAAPSLERVVTLGSDGQFRLGLEFFRHHRERVAHTWSEGAPQVERLYTTALEALAGPARAPGSTLDERHLHLAARVQQRFEQALEHWLHTTARLPASDALVLSGGCAMNGVAVGKLLRASRYRHIHVPAAAGDAGGAVGAAALAYQQVSKRRPDLGASAYLGPQMTVADIHAALATLDPEHFAHTWLTREELLMRTAAAIAQGKVVAWARGRMEWGARALGNRSILADPRRADMRERLNHKIKQRESFRPFAPSVLREHMHAWFERDCEVPFMTHVLPVTAPRRAQIPAVVNVDGTARVHTVSAESNPDYHALISEFWRLTGVPMVLNTSFNESEPIVCTAVQAVACFERTGLDLLVLGDCVISRKCPAVHDNIA